MNNYHLVHRDGDWKLERENATRASEIYAGMTKVESVHRAADFMQSHHGSMKIHKMNGVIQEERTYPRSADPRGSVG
jgi:Uncharacterized protein conserved in bacteria (DUF2188)